MDLSHWTTRKIGLSIFRLGPFGNLADGSRQGDKRLILPTGVFYKKLRKHSRKVKTTYASVEELLIPTGNSVSQTEKSVFCVRL